jgi:membrane protein YdbS with pleckstrin-like domain
MTSDAVPGTREPFDPTDVTWTPVSSRLIGARLTVTAIVLGPVLVLLVLLAVLVGAAWLWVFPAVVVLLVGWILWLVPRQVHALAYAERADDLLVRRGIMFRSLVVVPYGRMQYVDIGVGPVERGLGLCTLKLHTASAGTNAEIPGLPADEGARLREQLSARGAARLAGL